MLYKGPSQLGLGAKRGGDRQTCFTNRVSGILLHMELEMVK